MESEKHNTKGIPWHPGTLPPYMKMEDFVKFLSIQNSVLDELETLIMEFEKGGLPDSPKKIKQLLHTMKGESGFLALKDVQMICHRTEDLLAQELSQEFAQILFLVKDWLSETFNVYAGASGTPTDFEDLLEMMERYESLSAPEKGKKKTRADEAAFTPPDPGEKAGSVSPAVTVKNAISIESDRLDRMIDVIGELAIAQAFVVQSHDDQENRSTAFTTSLRVLGQITKELQSIGFSLRMVPLKSLFNRMARVARDLSKKSGKELNFLIKGETTELDKNLVDGLSDPLIHMIRNSIDHGIEENPRDRIAAGKPEVATLNLEAYHKGGNLHIEISDDGRGIHRDKLIEKAIRAGIIEDGSELTEEDMCKLIFQSGLSTKDTITDISGRGVGMDVVNDRISAFNGKIDIESKQGEGTTFHVTLPLTLAMMDGMIVRAGEQRYVIPTLSVITSLRPLPGMITTAFQKNEVLLVQGRMVPLVRLHRVFDIPGAVEDVCNGVVVVVENSGSKVAILVDELIAKHNIVRKNLGAGMQDIRGISGGTIMPDGKVCLILDIGEIVSLSGETCN